MATYYASREQTKQWYNQTSTGTSEGIVRSGLVLEAQRAAEAAGDDAAALVLTNGETIGRWRKRVVGGETSWVRVD